MQPSPALLLLTVDRYRSIRVNGDGIATLLGTFKDPPLDRSSESNITHTIVDASKCTPLACRSTTLAADIVSLGLLRARCLPLRTGDREHNGLVQSSAIGTHTRPQRESVSSRAGYFARGESSRSLNDVRARRS